jgi:hypothetical protein
LYIYLHTKWTAGRSLDFICDTVGVVNSNANPTKPQLRLFHSSSGEVKDIPFTTLMGTFESGEEIWIEKVERLSEKERESECG